MVQAYQSHFLPSEVNKLIIDPDFNHFCCWVEKWPELAVFSSSFIGLANSANPDIEEQNSHYADSLKDKLFRRLNIRF